MDRVQNMSVIPQLLAFENAEINDPEEAEELTCSEADKFRELKVHNLRAQTAKKKEKRT